MFHGNSRQQRYLRVAAQATSLFLTWNLTMPSFAAGRANSRPAPLGRTRHLNAHEMGHIRGAQAASTPSSGLLSADAGGSQPWQGSSEGTNTSNGNKTTDLPLVQWGVRGGRLAVDLTLYHNSQGAYDREVGHLWNHSYDILMALDGLGNPSVQWADGRVHAYTLDITHSTFAPPTGIHDTLTVSGSGTSAVYTLVTKDQITYTFQYYATTTSSGGDWYCTSIADRNGNTISISHGTDGLVTGVTDPTGRTLTFTYTSGKITSITATAGSTSGTLYRTFTLAYGSSTGDLDSVTFPTAGSTTPVVAYTYDSAHRITDITDARGKDWQFGYDSSGRLVSEKNPLQVASSTLGQTSYA